MKKKLFTLFLLPSFLFSETLEKVVSNFETSTFKANVTIETNSGNIRGEMYYQNGNVYFRLSDGRIISSNMRQIIVYDPVTKVAGKQDRDPGGGLSWVLSYPVTITGNKAIIEPPQKTPYEKIIITWNQNLFPTNIQFLKGDSYTNFRFSQIVFLNNISFNFFSYKPPAGSRTVENPLNAKR